MRSHPYPLGFLAALLVLGASASHQSAKVEVPPAFYFPGANSRPTYFTIHNVYEAWATSKGRGVKVGVLDHSFGFRTHPGLYAGGANFQTGEWGEPFDSVSWHGYWMAATLREMAPEVEVYALGTHSSNEGTKVDAMVRAIDWAIEHQLNVLTYSGERFSAAVRPRLDSAVNRALAKGMITTFIHYPHPDNLLPTCLCPRGGDDERDPDVNIFPYDYSVLFTKQYADWMERGSASGYRPFLSISSTSPVTAAFVAILKSARPDLGPTAVKRVLMETSHRTTFEGRMSQRTVDVAAAVRSVTAQPK
jgi:hypothetical protein